MICVSSGLCSVIISTVTTAFGPGLHTVYHFYQNEHWEKYPQPTVGPDAIRAAAFGLALVAFLVLRWAARSYIASRQIHL